VALPGLQVRKLADRAEQERIVRFDPETGEKRLVNPATPGDGHEPWPLLGIELIGDPPKEARVSQTWVMNGIDDGWLELEGDRPEHRPGGPPGNRWRVTHTFIHADAIIIHTISGDVRYKITHQPDKYAESGDDDTKVTDEHYVSGDTRVDWFYDLKLES
jgi:hypothetical protein